MNNGFDGPLPAPGGAPDRPSALDGAPDARVLRLSAPASAALYTQLRRSLVIGAAVILGALILAQVVQAYVGADFGGAFAGGLTAGVVGWLFVHQRQVALVRSSDLVLHADALEQRVEGGATVRIAAHEIRALVPNRQGLAVRGPGWRVVQVFAALPEYAAVEAQVRAWAAAARAQPVPRRA